MISSSWRQRQTNPNHGTKNATKTSDDEPNVNKSAVHGSVDRDGKNHDENDSLSWHSLHGSKKQSSDVREQPCLKPW